jgi:HSP20 family protein
MAGPLIPRYRTTLLPDLLDWLEAGIPGMRGSTADTHTIPVEIDEEEGVYLVRAELPGMDPEHDIDVTASDDIVAIRAQHTETKQDKHRSEFRYGTFQRVVRLPFAIPEDGVEAGYRSGVLTLCIPKPAHHKDEVRNIPVQMLD